MQPVPTAWVDAAPFRAYLRHLCEVTNLPWQLIAVHAGVSTSLVRHLLYGNHGRTITRIAPASAARILQVSADGLRELACQLVPATFTGERVRHLLARGLSREALAGFCRLSPAELDGLTQRRNSWCTRLTHELVRAADAQWHESVARRAA